MSGGHFEYKQYDIAMIADEIENIIKNNDSDDVDSYGDKVGRGFSKPTIKKFKNAVIELRRAHIMAQRIDWLISGDDGEDSFHSRWESDLLTLGKP